MRRIKRPKKGPISYLIALDENGVAKLSHCPSLVSFKVDSSILNEYLQAKPPNADLSLKFVILDMEK